MVTEETETGVTGEDGSLAALGWTGAAAILSTVSKPVVTRPKMT